MKIIYKNKTSEKELETDFSINNQDTIEIIKKKIAISLKKERKNVSINEIYLYTHIPIKFSTLKILHILTNNFLTPITYSILKNFCKNFSHINIDDIPYKSNYDYYDILNLNFDEPVIMYISLSLYSKNQNFIVNPFLLETENFSNDIQVNTQYNKLLLETSKLHTDSLYFCLAKDLFSLYDKSIHSSYISKTYFPFLYNNGIEEISQLLDFNDTDEYKNSIEKSENILNRINNYSDIKINNEGIKHIYFKIYPLIKINFPLRIIFDYLHTTYEYPFLKLNPGMKIENLIKLYSHQKTIDNQKIPYLSRKKIIELKNISGIGNKLAIFINTSENNDVNNLICEFDSNGIVHITMNNHTLLNITEIEDILNKHLNPLLHKINNYTTQYGYSTVIFDEILDNNVEIIDITYESKMPITKMNSIKQLLPCLSDSFNYIESDDDKYFNLVYKKISNFAQMGANEQLILDQFQKTQNSSDIIDYMILNNPDIPYDKIREQVLDVINDLQQKAEQFENMRFKNVKHPGFPVYGKFEKQQNSNNLHISISKINNLNYLNIINTYCKFIFAFYNEYGDINQDIKNCQISKTDVQSKLTEISNIDDVSQLDDTSDEFDEFDDIVFDDDEEEDFEDTMIGGGKSSSLKNPTLFFEKMFEHDETLFPKKSDSRFNAYSRSCPPNYKRQPVMLTEKEFIDISNNHPDSFYGYIKYGSSPDKEAYYICPRYWCLKTQTSLSKKEIFEENKCGGKDAIIPYDKIPKTIEDLPAGKSIYEFYHDVEHGDGKKKYPDYYRVHYPGFIESSKHEKGLSMPCCMKAAKVDNSGNYIENQLVSLVQKNRVNQNASKFSHHYNLSDKRNIEERSIKKERDDDGYIFKQESVSDLTAKFSKLGPGQLGYLPLKLQYMLQFDNTTCYKQSNEHLIKTNTPCMLRLGIEDNQKQSFMVAITKIYNIVNSTDFTLQEMKEKICQLIDIDIFVKLQNGNLIQVFQESDSPQNINLKIINKFEIIDSTIKDPNPPPDPPSRNSTKTNYYLDIGELLEKYKTTKVYDIAKVTPIFLVTIIRAYENFKKFIKSDSEYIDYTYLWDIICKPYSKLFPNGVDLIILDITNTDSTNRIDVLCPSNQYSNDLYSNKQTIILIKQTNINEETNMYYDVFEPIILFEIIDNKQKIYNPIFDKEKSIPKEIKNIIKSIKKHLCDKCNPFNMPSIPGKFKYHENDSLLTLIDKIKKINQEIIYLVLGFDFKCIGIKFKTNNNLTGFIPCYPSSIEYSLKVNEELKNVDIVLIDNINIWSSYDDTIEFLNQVKKYNKEIYCSPRYLLEEQGKLVGLYTETNQFIQFNPPISNDIVREYPIESVDTNPINVDKSIFYSNKINFNNSYAQKLKCEQAFLNAFRLLCRDKLAQLSNMKSHHEIKLYIEDESLPYDDKIKKISSILKIITKKYVKFINYTEEELSKISNVSLCNSNNTNLFCEGEKLKIPKINLITNDLNSNTYLTKVADELIRYKTTRDFILDPKQLFFFPTESSSLNNDEILVYDSEINDLFTHTLKAAHPSDFSLNKTADTITHNIDFEYNNIDSIECVQKPKYLGKTIKQIKDKLFPDKTFVRVYDNISYCTIQLLSEIYQAYMNKVITPEKIKEDLIYLYKEQIEKNKIQFHKAMQRQKKTNLYKLSNTDINISAIINDDDFYVCNLDIWMFVNLYKIPTILLSNNTNAFDDIRSNMIILYSLESDIKNNSSYIFIIAPAMQLNKPGKYQMLTRKSELESALFDVNTLTTSQSNVDSIFTSVLFYKNHYKDYDPKSKLIRTRKKSLTLDDYISM